MNRRFLIVVAGATVLAACSCGSSPSDATATPTAVVLDHCLVGTWKSTNITGSITIAGSPVTLSGGAGEVITIAATGAIRTDDSNTAALTGTAAGGSAYKLAQSGTATGTISATRGRVAVKLDQPTTLTLTLSKDGAVVQSQHPGSATDSYTCAAGSSLVITGGGGTVSTYAPR
ncbi:MAG: hypothetical protein JF886_00075 [Candidatus Dormibacteraeota bacterium]|uniref:Lipocalin-like domain-containing protein n=1 Tax=Candidatus Aeolococcus gillhamiae TaxID=3127015 RepID=A0A2W5Z247_9BACT|nr:hypothetical protein [Candidatus Dormibacteraeota bacterium]PZR79292.1 MAG: hypothetical protein DLM65_11040 [Candidatus Dormibacter sp. RRmetagenome_bin12]